MLARWERERRRTMTLAELAREVGRLPAPYVASKLVRKGVFQRVGRGSYVIRPFRSLLRPSTQSTPVLAAALLSPEPYYLGGLWAVSFHRLSEQQYASICDAFVASRRAPRVLGPGRLRFHRRAPELLAYGVQLVTLEESEVRVSDRERTVLDALDHPRLFLGIDAGVALLTANWNSLDLRKLVAHAVRGSSVPTCQRLGVLLERNGEPTSRVRSLRAKVRGTRSLLSLYPGGRRDGVVNTRWNVVENEP